MHIINFSFICGFSIGLEFYTGEDLAEDDNFAMTIDLGIIRFTYVLTEATE